MSWLYSLLILLKWNCPLIIQVIIKKDGKIKLYCKGADTMIFERLHPSSDKVKRETTEHLNHFAGEGLRTLCLAKKDLDEEFVEKWKVKLHEAATSLDNREDKISAVYELIETDLTLVGATAIEDKLQDGVPECIANLSAANIKIWVLTGDKQETAINIGYSCQLLTDDLIEVFTIEGWECDEVEQELQKCRETMRNVISHNKVTGACSVVTFSDGSDATHMSPGNNLCGKWIKNGQQNLYEKHELYGTNKIAEDANGLDPPSGFALVINGHSLVHALQPSMELLFLEVASQCKSVICCRVTPLQKALVVDLVKRHKKAVTLAIGDGANDVSMIKSKLNLN